MLSPQIEKQISELEQKLEYFKNIVHSMRCLQKKYWETRYQKDFIEAEKAERKVDSILEIL